MNILMNSNVSITRCLEEVMDITHNFMLAVYGNCVLINTVRDKVDPDNVYLVYLLENLPNEEQQKELYFATKRAPIESITVHTFKDSEELVRIGFGNLNIETPFVDILGASISKDTPLAKTSTFAIYPQHFSCHPDIGFKYIYQSEYKLEDMLCRESTTPLILMGLHRNGYWVSADSYKQLAEVVNDGTVPYNAVIDELLPLLFYGDSITLKPMVEVIAKLTMVLGPLLHSTMLDMLTYRYRYQYLLEFFNDLNGMVPTREMVEDLIAEQGHNLGFNGSVPLLTDEHIGEHPRPEQGALTPSDIMIN